MDGGGTASASDAGTERRADALDATCADDAFRLDMRLEPGDAQWLHNHTTFHARSAYERGSDRHLLRVWVAPENASIVP